MIPYYIANSENYITSIQYLPEGELPKGINGIKKEDNIETLCLMDNNNLFNYKIINQEIITVSQEEKNQLLEQQNIKQSQALNNEKNAKITFSKELLKNYLELHPLISICHNNTKAIYSVTLEKQNLMLKEYYMHLIAKSLGQSHQLKWNSKGAEKEIWTEEEFIQLMLEVENYVNPLVALQQFYETQIKNCSTYEELNNINIIYNITY